MGVSKEGWTAPQNNSPTHILTVFDLLQGLDLPQDLVGDAILQPPQGHLLEGNDLSSLFVTEHRHCQPVPAGKTGATPRVEVLVGVERAAQPVLEGNQGQPAQSWTNNSEISTPGS